MAATAELSLTLDPMENSLKNLLVWNFLLNWNKTSVEWFLGGPLSELYPMTPPAYQDNRHSWSYFNEEPNGKFIDNFLVCNYLLSWNQTLLKLSLGGLLSELYPMTPPANQDGRHSRT